MCRIFSKNKVNIFFHILTKCNLKCRHCYINTEQHGENILDIETICSWLALFYKLGQNINVVFLGGEPTLHPDLSVAIKFARNLKYNSIMIDTNGYLFNNILSNIGSDDVKYINFSLDGPTAESNDIIRGKGAYDQCIKGIYAAKNQGFNVGLIFTVSSFNINYLDQMPFLLFKLGIDIFFIQVMGVRGNWVREKNVGNMLKQVDRETWLRIVPCVVKDAVQYGIKVSYPKVFLRTEELFECAGIVADNYFVFPNGRVYRCPLCEDFPLHSIEIKNNRMVRTDGINEQRLFSLNISEGCVMNKLIQPIDYALNNNNVVQYKIACCMLKEEINNY